MTASEPPGEQPPGDETALFVAALNHSWAWYDGRISRALQVINYYFVASAVLGAAYTSAITHKNYGLAAAIAGGALGITAVASATVFREVDDATRAEPVLAELQGRVGRRLNLRRSIQLASPELSRWQRRFAVMIAIGLASLFNISALIYALVH